VENIVEKRGVETELSRKVVFSGGFPRGEALRIA
jgi:hypothetical protein